VPALIINGSLAKVVKSMIQVQTLSVFGWNKVMWKHCWRCNWALENQSRRGIKVSALIS